MVRSQDSLRNSFREGAHKRRRKKRSSGQLNSNQGSDRKLKQVMKDTAEFDSNLGMILNDKKDILEDVEIV